MQRVGLALEQIEREGTVGVLPAATRLKDIPQELMLRALCNSITSDARDFKHWGVIKQPTRRNALTRFVGNLIMHLNTASNSYKRLLAPNTVTAVANVWKQISDSGFQLQVGACVHWP
jgi:hypothetical protein